MEFYFYFTNSSQIIVACRIVVGLEYFVPERYIAGFMGNTVVLVQAPGRLLNISWCFVEQKSPIIVSFGVLLIHTGENFNGRKMFFFGETKRHKRDFCILAYQL